MPCHVAVVTAEYVRPILDGRKAIECRLTRTAVPPFGCIAPGQRIYFKQSAGPFFATAVADRVWMTDRLDPASVDRLRTQHDAEILGGGFWKKKREVARYGTLIWLREVQPCDLRPQYRPQNMRAWYVLDDAADPLARGTMLPPHHNGAAFDVEITAGALRQSAVRIGGVLEHFPADAMGGRTREEAGRLLSFALHRGPTVETDIVTPQKMLRWRGWRKWFADSGLQPGDRLRFVPHGPRAFKVHAVRQPKQP